VRLLLPAPGEVRLESGPGTRGTSMIPAGRWRHPTTRMRRRAMRADTAHVLEQALPGARHLLPERHPVAAEAARRADRVPGENW